MFANGFAAVILASFLACAVTTIGIWVISKHERWGREHSTYFMSFAASALVYVGASHLLPAVEKENRRHSFLALAAGVLVAVFIIISKG
jgi:zinc transporter ZupT